MPGSSPGTGGSGPPGDAPRWAQPGLDTHPGHPEPQQRWQGHGECLGQRTKPSRDRERDRRATGPTEEPRGRTPQQGTAP